MDLRSSPWYYILYLKYGIIFLPLLDDCLYLRQIITHEEALCNIMRLSQRYILLT